MPFSKSLAAIAVLGCSAATSWAQAPSTPNRTILLAMAANAKQITNYEWKQRITVTRRGHPAPPVIDQVRFNGGQLQRTAISAPPPQQGGIRGKIAAGVKEDVTAIMEIAGSYNKPQQLADAVKKAQVSSQSGATRLQANGLLKPSDSMTMLLDPATHLARHIDINTDYEGSPMTIAQDYSTISNGPNMMTQMKVSVPKKELNISVDSYDFARAASH
jgi:hypothetical protein